MQVAGALDTECGGNKLTHQTLLNGHALAVGALSADDGEQGMTTIQAAASGMLIAFQQNTRDEVRLIGGDGKIAGALAAEAGMKQQNYLAPARMVAFGEYVEDGTASAMKARDYKDATDLVAVDAYNQTVSDTSQALSSSASDINHTGGAIVPAATAIQDVTDRDKKQNGRGWNADGTSYTLDAAATQGVAQVQWASGGGQLENPTAQALRSGAKHNYQFARVGMAVRRLTPTECERLQGFPDSHTLIPWKKKPADQCPDGPRYKALGNSMAVNCMGWLGQRIDFYDKQS
jgi:DNA (cytosine-5)-methyltransferase 1